MWDKIMINLGDGDIAEAIAPVIISASRATDIPAFHIEKLIESMKKGYTEWMNPFNGKIIYISFSKCRAMVFWTKNPKPMMEYLEYIDKTIKNYYFQFTLNDYGKEGLEVNMPSLEERIFTFISLSEKIGREKVIWRFDPLIMTDQINVGDLIEKVWRIGSRLQYHTNKLVFSFVDVEGYRKVERAFKKKGIKYIPFSEADKLRIAKELANMGSALRLKVATCCEDISLEHLDIEHNRCVDNVLLRQLFSKDADLMDFLAVAKKDTGQRKNCGCIKSKDIGRYGTCLHDCIYCYAR